MVDQLADMGVAEVTLIGGEAYLRNDFLLVIRRIRERGMIASLTTGGYNFTRARVEGMVEAGVMNVGVSIDGLEASHDRVRNRPESWKRAFAAIAETSAKPALLPKLVGQGEIGSLADRIVLDPPMR